MKMFFCVVISIFLSQPGTSSSDNKSPSTNDEAKWGMSFDGVKSKNIKLDCKYQKMPICCEALTEKQNSSLNDLSDRDIHITKHKGRCTTTRLYVPSPYEIRHSRKAEELSNITNNQLRKTYLMDFMSSFDEVISSLKWMERVKFHMNSNNVYNKESSSIKYTSDDFEYLSYFNVTRHCHGNRSNRSWIEWIEPLSIHIRDPFCFHTMSVAMWDRMAIHIKNSSLKVPMNPLQSNNYVLLQNGAHMSQYELGDDHRIRRNSKYMLDTGTSRFDSSLWWFTCGYAQRGIELDQLFGWEVTLLEPNDFWKKVPPRWRQSYHFFNTPISSDPSNEWHPLRFIQAMGIRESDFVSFKLDIDTVDVELPIALELLTNPEFSSLIDEFFFELHFKCEMLGPKWESLHIPDTFGKLKLDRVGVMAFFTELRRKGIRAHFWP